jgi:alpha-N-arabinofuranosidase
VNGNRQSAPNLLEEIYDLGDALLVGGLLNSLIRKSERVRLACLAQLVNVIAPIMTNAGGLYRQTIYYPYAWALHLARGSALELLVESPAYEVSGIGAVPPVDVAGTVDAKEGNLALFLLNRDLSKAHEIEVNWQDNSPRLVNSTMLTGADLKTTNTFDAPNRVAPQGGPKATTVNGRSRIEAPPQSYTAMQWKLS